MPTRGALGTLSMGSLFFTECGISRNVMPMIGMVRIAVKHTSDLVLDHFESLSLFVAERPPVVATVHRAL